MSRQQVRRIAAMVAAVALAVVTGVVGNAGSASATAGQAVVTSYTWTGMGTTRTGPRLAWSDPQNWVSGAPADGQHVGTLTFPALSAKCDSSAFACEVSDNDLTGLTADSLVFGAPGNVQGSEYTVTGDKLTLGSGGLTVAAPPDEGSNGAELSTPLTLDGDQTWELGPATETEIDAPVGAGSVLPSLGVDLGNSSDTVFTSPVEVGPVTFEATDPGGTSAAPVVYLRPDTAPATTADIDGTDGDAVLFKDVQVLGVGTVGALEGQGTRFFVGPGELSPGTLTADSVTLDAASQLHLDIDNGGTTPGADFSQLLADPSAPGLHGASSGAVDLGGAALDISLETEQPNHDLACFDPVAGNSWPLVVADSLTGEVSDGNGDPIPDGGILSVEGCTTQPGGTAPTYMLRITYSGTTLTATAIGTSATATTTTATTDPTTAVSGSAVTYSSTVTGTGPGASAPIGTVAFSDGSLALCTALLTAATPTASTASCSSAAAPAGVDPILATYTPTAASDFASSAGTTTLDVDSVAGAPGSVSSVSATSDTPNGTVTVTDGGFSVTAVHGEGTVVLSLYDGAPGGDVAPLKGSLAYIDVRLDPGSTFTSLIIVGPVPSGGTAVWYDTATGTYRSVLGDPALAPAPGHPGDDSVTLTATTSPDLSQLGATVFAIGLPVPGVTPPGTPPPTPTPTPRPTPGSRPLAGYRMVASDGGVFDFGEPFYGSTGGIRLVKPVVAMADALGGKGYYLVATDGGVFTFGPDAHFKGSTGGIALRQPIVGMAVDPATGGYWLVAADGGVFSFDAPFYGSTGGIRLHQPIVGMAAAPDGRGYYLVARDGGIFTFGPGTRFQGSTGGVRLDKPVVGMAVDPVTGGYWLVASDGGVFSFDAPFYGSTGNVRLVRPVVGIAADGLTGGYRMVASDGGVFCFRAAFLGSTGGIALVRPMVGMAS